MQGAANMSYQGKQFQRRDPTFTVNIVGDTPREWRELDSAFRMALGMYDEQFHLMVETEDSTRHLDLRLLQDPTPWENGPWESGRDSHNLRASTLLVPAAAEQPFWYADDLVFTWSTDTGNGSVTFPYENRGDVIVWPKYFVNAPLASLELPDKSWGQEVAYQRPPGADTNHTITVVDLRAGEDSDIDSDPDEEFIVAANRAPVWARQQEALIYPIAPKTLPTDCTITISGANPGAGVTVTIPRRYSRPIGVSV
ncbi:hypothetical protein [Nocardia spumae]|uniref:hypothetical protein n=1 Tax=Nocardia spumae TaxID=2887190 RepID=UPI001D133444|nr:hypothetical protein [Nocardia spumae]